jgi:PKHD-type hydroxylase
MITDPLYWLWKEEIPETVCKAIIEEGIKLQIEPAVISEQNIVDEEVRKSKVSWFETNSWVAGILQHYAFLANDQAWKFNLSGVQKPQFTIYEPGGFYNFHEDASQISTLMRKISIVITITDPSTYEGGNFEFADGTVPDIRSVGSILVFPSFISHRVAPVTEGIRYSLVCWVEGPGFS